MIKITDLTIQYDQKIIKEHLNIEFPSKGLVGVYGASGCGKSSLFQILAGVNPHYTGEVFFNEFNLKDSSFEFFKENVTYIPQEYNCFEENTVEDNILLSVSDLTQFDYYIQRYNLSSLLKQKMYKLSLGEHQRVSLVITFLQKKKINLLDELLCNLDSETKLLALEDLKLLAKESLILLIAHQIEDVRSSCDKLLDLSTEKNWSLSSPELEYQLDDKEFKLSFFKIKTYGNKVLNFTFIGFILMAMAISIIALNIATSSYTKSYMADVIQDDPLGMGVNITSHDNLEDYFKDVEIPFYDLSLLKEYYADESHGATYNDYVVGKGRLCNFMVLDEIELNGKKIQLKDMEIVLPNEVTDVSHYDEDGKFNYTCSSSIVQFTEGNIFKLFPSNLCDVELVIRKTYNRKKFYDVLSQYFDEVEAQRYSEIVIVNQTTFVRLMSRLLNLQVTLKSPIGDITCTICPYEAIDGAISSTPMEINDGEMDLSFNNNSGLHGKKELGYVNSFSTVSFSYKDKQYSKNFNFKALPSHSTLPLIWSFPPSEFASIRVSYNDFFEIMSSLDCDLLEKMKPCNRFIDLRKNCSSIIEKITANENNIIFTNLPELHSRKAFQKTKMIYSIVSSCLVVLFFVSFFGYSKYNSKELENTDRIMRYKMYSPKKRLAYIRYKNLLIPILLSCIGILLGLIVVLLGYYLNLDYFYSIQWQPYIISLAELIIIIIVYFMIEKLSLRKNEEND